jgi:Fic family protein
MKNTKLNQVIRQLVALDKVTAKLPRLSRVEKDVVEVEQQFESVYNSNKLEGNKLSKAEARQAILSNRWSVADLTKREIDILEERGLWVASSSLNKVVQRLIKKVQPVETRYIISAHRVLFTKAQQPKIGGRFRNHNGPDLIRIDESLLKMTDWRQVPEAIAQLNDELKAFTHKLRPPKTESEYEKIISITARLSNRWACIHPFENGNGRSSRLLINAILLRGRLPQIAFLSHLNKKKSKERYLKAMFQADNGDFSVLETMIGTGIVEAKQKESKKRKQAEMRNRSNPSSWIFLSMKGISPSIKRRLWFVGHFFLDLISGRFNGEIAAFLCG